MAFSRDSDQPKSVVERWASNPGPAAIFDFNGTLSDDEPILFRIFTELFQTHLDWSMSVDYYNRHLLGHSDREIIEKVLATTAHPASEVEPLLELRKHRYRELVAGDNPIQPATVELVRALADHGVPIGIVTGAQRDDVDAVLRSSPVGDWISVIVTEEDVAHGKPDPEGFLSGAAQLGCRPQSTLVFEDSLPGVRGARAAGMWCIAVGDRPSVEIRATAQAVVPVLSAQIIDHVLPLLVSNRA